MPKKTTGYSRLMGPKKNPPRKFTPKPGNDDTVIAAAVVVALKTKKDRGQKPKNHS